MIYVISEDIFLCKGIITIFNNIDKDVVAININHENFTYLVGHVTSNDIILLCAQSRGNSRALSRLARITDATAFYFIDTITKERILLLPNTRVISKKSTAEELVELTQNVNREMKPPIVSLTRKEIIVMDMLTQQHDAYRIAELMHLSAKTVFAHKMNALRKLGLSHLNARSILLYERCFQSRV
jgi:DNA-binding CsgD family transcriptional regulator